MDHKTSSEMGIIGPNDSILITMGNMAIIFRAETITKFTHVLKNFLEGDIRNRQFCRIKLNILSRQIMVTLKWVPGHIEVVGNKKADDLEKILIGPERYGPNTRQVVQTRI